MGRKRKTRSLLSPFTIVVMTVIISAFMSRYFTDPTIERPHGSVKKQPSAFLKAEKSKKQISINQEHPDILIEAFAEIKRGYDGSAYPPGYRSKQLKEARSRLKVTDIRKLPEGATVQISTSFNPIDLVLPANTDAVVKAKTDFGEIESDFPVHMSKKEINVKSGQVLIDLKTSDDITVLKK